MAFKEYDVVVLAADRPELGLRAGISGTILMVHGKGMAFEVEFTDGDGVTIVLATLPVEDLRPLRR